MSQQIETRKSIWQAMIALSIPTIVEQILETIVQYVDTAMVGHLGEQATAAVSVTTTINWLIHSLMSAFGVGLLALIARSIGERNREQIGKLSVLVVWVIVLAGTVEGAAAMLLGPYIPVWMGAEIDVQRNASMYFLIISIPMLFRASSILCGAAIRASGDTKTPMKITMTANVINVVFNYVLIYIVGLGVIGAAIASAMAYTFGGAAMFVMFRRKQVFSWKGESRFPDREVVGKWFKISMPAALTNTASCMGQIVFTSLVSGMGTIVFAAHSIAVTAETIFYIPGYGMSTAVSTQVGMALGERNEKKYKMIAGQAVLLTLVMMCISGVLLFIFSDGIMRIFTPNEEVASLGARMLRIVAVSEPFFGLMIIMQGIYNGSGRTGFAFWVETCSMWGVRILFSMLCVRVWHLQLDAVWYCMIADNIIKASLYAIGFKKKSF